MQETPRSRKSSRMSEVAVEAQTGKTWPQWFAILDEAGMKGKDHKEIVRHLTENYEIAPWWRQIVTVEYVRWRGKRRI